MRLFLQLCFDHDLVKKEIAVVNHQLTCGINDDLEVSDEA
jgi:hypothetical protein